MTLKTRLGWDDDHKNAPTIAKIAENEGVQMLAIHGRTRTQMYKGSADWELIAQTVDAVSIPVCANGDIIDVTTAQTALRQSNAQGLLVGRGAMGRPWLLGQIADMMAGKPIREAPSLATRLSIMEAHISLYLDLYPEARLRHLRKHLSAYCDYMPSSEALRTSLMIADSREKCDEALTHYRQQMAEQEAA